MVRVGKNQLLSRLLCLPEIHSLEGGVGGDCYKSRGVDNAVRCVQASDACTRFGGLVQHLEAEKIPWLVGPVRKVARCGEGQFRRVGRTLSLGKSRRRRLATGGAEVVARGQGSDEGQPCLRQQQHRHRYP